MLRIIGILCQAVLLNLVPDQPPPWSDAAMIRCRHDQMSPWSTIHRHDPRSATNTIQDYTYDHNQLRSGIRMRWWWFCWRLEDTGVEVGSARQWKRLTVEQRRGFKVWQVLNDWLKETVADPIGHLGTPTISWSISRLSFPDWTYA